MYPYILRFVHPLTGELVGITTYAVLMFLGAILGILLAIGLGYRRNLPAFDLFGASAIAFGVGLLGARVLFLLIHGKELVVQNGWTALLAPGGGLIWYGGLLGGAVSFIIYCRLCRLSIPKMLDAAAPGLALGQAFGRIGCFTAGCCHGSIAPPGKLSIIFPQGGFAPAGLALYPTQLYEAVFLFALTGLLAVLAWPRTPNRTANGSIAAIYLISYAILRFFIENFRGDQRGAEILNLSISQVLSLAILLSVTVFLIFISLRSMNKPNTH